MGILWQVQSLDKHGFLPAAEIKVVCLDVDGRDWLGGSFPHRQGTWQLRSGGRHITALKISSAFDARHRAVIQSVPWLEPARIKPHHVLPLRTASQQAGKIMKTKLSSRKMKDFNLLVSCIGGACGKQKQTKQNSAFSWLYSREKCYFFFSLKLINHVWKKATLRKWLLTSQRLAPR